MARKSITSEMKWKALLTRQYIPCGICGERVRTEQEIDWDHVHALVHGGLHHFGNIRPVHAECHKIKTAQDIKDNAKVKRLLNPMPSRHPMQNSGRKLPSRPFPKRVAG